MAAPYYDNVMMPGAGGIRVPTEVFGSAGAGLPGATFALDKAVNHSYASSNVDWTLNASETAGSVITVTLAGGAANAIFPAAQPGGYFIAFNNSGSTVTFKVVGQTGVAVATAKRAILTFTATDVARVTADT